MAIKKIYYNGSVFEPLTPTTTQKAAIDSGITSAKVTTYDGYQAKIDAKQDKLNRTITLKGDIKGTVTDKGGNLEIDTSQDPDDLDAVLTQGNTSAQNIILSKDSSVDTITPTSITLTDNSNNKTVINPAQITISSTAGNLTLSFVNGFSITASDGVADAFREWLEAIPQTADISGVGYYKDFAEASAAPQGIIAFYPESE